MPQWMQPTSVGSISQRTKERIGWMVRQVQRIHFADVMPAWPFLLHFSVFDFVCNFQSFAQSDIVNALCE